MNREIAKRRYMDVFRPDVMHSSHGDFLATHVPMKKLYVTQQLTDHAEVPEQEKKNPKTEEEVYERFMGEMEEDQFVLVIGDSGAGKSHLIRWIDTVHKMRKSEKEVVLPIRRADNTLKGTIRQLIDLPEVKSLPNKELYKKLLSAATSVPEKELKETIYYQFIIQITNDDGKAGDEESVRRINNVDRKHLIALLQNSLFKDRLMESDGPIDRIYGKFAENKSNEVNDTVAEFKDEDFEIDSEFRNKLLLGADDKARKIADKLIDNNEFVCAVKEYINRFVEKVIQRCAGLEPGDLANVIEEIRRELFRQGKTLTILMEDITSASGVDDSLLDALLTDKIEYPEKQMCRINAIVGATDGYYREKFKTNTKGRIHNFVYVPDDLFGGNKKGLLEFFARYLNTISLDPKDIQQWVDQGKGEMETYPVHVVTIGDGWGEYKLGDKHINLFPFTQNSIMFLYDKQDIAKRNPRSLMRDIIETYVKESIEQLEDFPVHRPTFYPSNPELQNAIYNNINYDDSTKLRLACFMYVWGDGTLQTYEKKGVRYVAGLPENVYKELGLPVIDGNKVVVPTEEPSVPESTGSSSPEGARVPAREKENEQVMIALQEVDKWIDNKDYKLSIGATTKSVKALNNARKNINTFLFNSIDWQSEGVSNNAVQKVKNQDKFLVAFDRQTQKSDSVITLPASIESRGIIEAFVRWSEVGKESWNFNNSTDYLLRVQKWGDSIKPTLVKAILHYDDKKSDYFSFAVAAEFYRLILNGYCKNYQDPHNLSPELLLRKNQAVSGENGHTKSWNDLLRIVNGSDGAEARTCVLQYYNLVQGDVVHSINYEFDALAFNKAVKGVIKTGLHYETVDLQLDDPVKKRRLYSEYLKKIIDRLDIVVNDEKAMLALQLANIEKSVSLDDLESTTDIEDLIDEIGKFYSQAQKSHISIAIHYDLSKINYCKRNVEQIVKAINVAKQVAQTRDTIESLLLLSRDPLVCLKPFVELLNLAAADLEKTNSEVEMRMKTYKTENPDLGDTPYSRQQQIIENCAKTIEEVREHHVVG